MDIPAPPAMLKLLPPLALTSPSPVNILHSMMILPPLAPPTFITLLAGCASTLS